MRKKHFYPSHFRQCWGNQFNLHLQRPEAENKIHLSQVCSHNFPLNTLCSKHAISSKLPNLNVFRCFHFNPFCRLLLLIPTQVFSTRATFQPPDRKPRSPEDELKKGTQMDFSLVHPSGIAQSVISRCSYIWEERAESFVDTPLQDLLKLPHSLPAVTRPLWRASALKPQDALQVCQCFYFHRLTIKDRDVKFLWKLFNWADKQGGFFSHIPESHEIMVSMLVQVGMLKEAETLLHKMESRGTLLCNVEVLDKIIKGYVEESELDKSMAMYENASTRGLVLSGPCYQLLLNFLIRSNESQLALRVFLDMIEAGFALNAENHFEFVIGTLCKDNKIHEARTLLKKVMDFGVEPSNRVLNDIAVGYCEKKDFEDLLNFLTEWKYAPEARVCHKIISSHCRNLGTEKAWLFLQQLQFFGFMPDEITFGILICWSCKEGSLKDGFIYLGELLSRGLKPNVYAYNSLIAGMFKEGMGKHAKDIVFDMVEKGVRPEETTFRALLAGYCINREFDEAKLIVAEMLKCNLVSLSPAEDSLSKAFEFLGLNHLGVKVKRDNDPALPRAEFFDSLGNGLYLETDIEKYEKILTGIQKCAVIPSLDLVVVKECLRGNIENALRVKCEMVHWDQRLSVPTYSKLLKSLSASKFRFDSAIDLLDEIDDLRDQLDIETLNLLIRATSKKKKIYKASQILDWMLQRKLLIDNETFTALFLGFCKEKDKAGIRKCWIVAREHGWLPVPKDWKAIFCYLCRLGMLLEGVQLFGSLVEEHFDSISDICDIFLNELCVRGFTTVGHVLLEEALRRGLDLNHEAFNHLLRGLCMDKRFCEATGLLDILFEKKLILCDSVCRLLIPHFCRSNRLEKAMNLKEILLSRQPKVFVSVNTALINGLCKIGKVKESALLLQEMLEKGEKLDNEVYAAMIHGSYCENSFTHACELLCLMLRNGVNLSISTYRILVRMMCTHGRLLKVMKLKDFMLRDRGCPHLVVYNILIFHLFQTGSTSLVRELLNEMHERGVCFDRVTYNFLIYGYHRCGNVSKSVGILNNMIDKNLKPSSRCFRIAITYLSSHGKFEEVLELSRKMELKGWMVGSIIQNTLVHALLSCGRVQEAETCLDQMEGKGLVPDNIVKYDALIKQFCIHGRLTKAVELLNVMLKKGVHPSEGSYSCVICGLCLHGALDQALDFLTEMIHKNHTPSIQSCEMLVRALCSDRRAQEAERLFRLLFELGETPSRNMYQMVIDQYSKDNNLNKASEILRVMQQNGYEADFRTQWSLISNLSKGNDKNNRNGKGLLSSLLS